MFRILFDSSDTQVTCLFSGVPVESCNITSCDTTFKVSVEVVSKFKHLKPDDVLLSVDVPDNLDCETPRNITRSTVTRWMNKPQLVLISCWWGIIALSFCMNLYQWCCSMYSDCDQVLTKNDKYWNCKQIRNRPHVSQLSFFPTLCINFRRQHFRKNNPWQV